MIVRKKERKVGYLATRFNVSVYLLFIILKQKI